MITLIVLAIRWWVATHMLWTAKLIIQEEHPDVRITSQSVTWSKPAHVMYLQTAGIDLILASIGLLVWALV